MAGFGGAVYRDRRRHAIIANYLERRGNGTLTITLGTTDIASPLDVADGPGGTLWRQANVAATHRRIKRHQFQQYRPVIDQSTAPPPPDLDLPELGFSAPGGTHWREGSTPVTHRRLHWQPYHQYRPNIDVTTVGIDTPLDVSYAPGGTRWRQGSPPATHRRRHRGNWVQRHPPVIDVGNPPPPTPAPTFISFPPPRHTPGRAALGGQLKSLGANVQGYPNEEVEAVMRSGVAVWRPRFELYDTVGNRIEPDLSGVTEASVTYDETREIKGSLELTMLPDERLRHAFFRYLVKPYVGVQMPDGGFAEFPQGKYPWTKPKRIIEGVVPGASEHWTITLGDQLHYLDTAGPGLDPFITDAGVPGTDYIASALWLAGLTSLADFTGITWSDRLLPTSSWYTFVTTAHQAADGTWKNEGAQKWLGIEKELHKAIGYREPEFDNAGAYLARADRAWWAEPADVIYDTSDDGVVLWPSTIDPDLKKIANRAAAYTDTPGTEGGFGNLAGYFTQLADLNDWLPAHPLAQVNSKHYIDLDPPLKGAYSSDIECYAHALMGLFGALAYYEQMTLERVGFLAQHESSPIVGVQIGGDPELGGPVPLFQGLPESLPLEFQGLVDLTRPVALFRETARKLNLFTGDAESTLTRLARLQ